MKLKVCGLKDPINIKMLGQIRPDLMGFIFVKSSPRFIDLDDELIKTIKSVKSQKVGVFVNEPVTVINDIVEVLQLDYVQLHGDETPERVAQVSEICSVIKAFQVDDKFDFHLDGYERASLFLFDAKGNRRGGNGIKYNWNLLKRYQESQPFIVSGGIRLSDADAIRRIRHPKFIGVDINSGFELSPGIKNIDLVAQLKLELDEVYS